MAKKQQAVSDKRLADAEAFLRFSIERTGGSMDEAAIKTAAARLALQFAFLDRA